MQLSESNHPNQVTHLECSATGQHYPADRIQTISEAGKPLLVRYDLPSIKKILTREQLQNREPTLWRYKELLPLRAPPISLGETFTPLIESKALSQTLNLDQVLIKDEGRLPTGSFKARGLALAVNLAKSFGVGKMAIPTNGNAGSALAAYCSAAGIESLCFCPSDTPEVNLQEMAFYGAKTFKVNGLINDCGKIVKAGAEQGLWFDTATLREPYRIEGKKTMGFELADQMHWQLPDVILYPTGGGTGLIGMWKAFDELEALGLIGKSRPKMVAVQAEHCAPIVQAFEQGLDHAEPWANAQTAAAGIRVPVALGDFLILKAVRDSAGFATAVSDAAILDAQASIAKTEGILLCPEGAATAAALIQERKSGRIKSGSRVLLFNCATGLKYPMPAPIHRFDNHQNLADL